MNLLSMLHHEYFPTLEYNHDTCSFELYFKCVRINYVDCYNRLTREDLCVLRENANRIFIELEKNLSAFPDCKSVPIS